MNTVPATTIVTILHAKSIDRPLSTELVLPHLLEDFDFLRLEELLLGEVLIIDEMAYMQNLLECTKYHMHIV